MTKTSLYVDYNALKRDNTKKVIQVALEPHEFSSRLPLYFSINKYDELTQFIDSNKTTIRIIKEWVYHIYYDKKETIIYKGVLGEELIKLLQEYPMFRNFKQTKEQNNVKEEK